MKILVLETRGLNLAFLGCYGNDWIGTPNIDRLAAEGIVFDAHLLDGAPSSFAPATAAQAGTSVPETAAPACSDLVCEAGKTWRSVRCDKLPSFAETVAGAWDAFPGDGVCWIEGPLLAPPWRLPLDMLGAYRDDPHDAWRDPPQGAVGADFDVRRCQDTYAAVLTYFDEQVGRIVEHLRERGDEDDAMLVLTACAGLPLGERGEVGLSSLSLHEESMHVPLIWRLPRRIHAGLRIGALTQPADLTPSLLEALGASVPPTRGHNLWPLLRGETTSVRPYACVSQESTSGSSWLIRSPDWAFLQTADGECQLYVKPEDRWEMNDVRQQHPERVERFEKALRQWRDAPPHPGLPDYPSLDEPD